MLGISIHTDLILWALLFCIAIISKLLEHSMHGISIHTDLILWLLLFCIAIISKFLEHSMLNKAKCNFWYPLPYILARHRILAACISVRFLIMSIIRQSKNRKKSSTIVITTLTYNASSLNLQMPFFFPIVSKCLSTFSKNYWPDYWLSQHILLFPQSFLNLSEISSPNGLRIWL